MLKPWNEMRSLDISKYVKQRDKADYLPWADCLKLLYENGAGSVRIFCLQNANGSSLFMSDETFTDKNGKTNKCYEVRLNVTIDDETYFMTYPVMNGISPVKDDLMNQNAVHKAQMRAFVKCVAINTGLGFDLWRDDSDIEEEGEDLNKHSLKAIKERMEQEMTSCISKGHSVSDIAKACGMDEEILRSKFSYFAELSKIEKKLLEILNQ
jgi:hypothetical protein